MICQAALNLRNLKAMIKRRGYRGVQDDKNCNFKKLKIGTEVLNGKI